MLTCHIQASKNGTNFELKTSVKCAPCNPRTSTDVHLEQHNHTCQQYKVDRGRRLKDCKVWWRTASGLPSYGNGDIFFQIVVTISSYILATPVTVCKGWQSGSNIR